MYLILFSSLPFLRLDDATSAVFWSVYHSSRPIYRIDPRFDDGPALVQLCQEKLLIDLVKEEDKTTLLVRTYDMLDGS